MNCSLCGSEENLDDRGAYIICGNCAQEKQECKDRQKTGHVLDRDCAPLCTQCGLCCIVLSAQLTQEELEHLSNWSGKLPSEIAMVEEDYPGGKEKKLALHRPCVFLLGKPTKYVSCRAYSTKRPIVCEEYLCKLAVRYKVGACTLNEALFIVRAVLSPWGHVGLFNWDSSGSGHDKNDQKLFEIIAARKMLRTLNDEDIDMERVKFHLFSLLHPKFDYGNSHKEALFAAVMLNFDNNGLELDHFFEPHQTAGWSDRDKKIANETIHQVVSDFRQLFECSSRSSP